MRYLICACAAASLLGCSAEAPAPPSHYLLAVYDQLPVAADSAAIAARGGTAIYRIALGNALLFQSVHDSATFPSLAHAVIQPLDGPDEFVPVAIIYRAQITPQDLAQIDSLSGYFNSAAPWPDDTLAVVTDFRLSSLNELVGNGNVSQVEFEFGGGSVDLHPQDLRSVVHGVDTEY